MVWFCWFTSGTVTFSFPPKSLSTPHNWILFIPPVLALRYTTRDQTKLLALFFSSWYKVHVYTFAASLAKKEDRQWNRYNENGREEVQFSNWYGTVTDIFSTYLTWLFLLGLMKTEEKNLILLLPFFTQTDSSWV